MSAKDDCYRLIQEISVARDPFCRAPGCERLSTCGHHLFPRSRLATAFDPRFIIGLCHYCHVPWAHAKTKEFQEWVISWMGEDVFIEGVRLSNSIVKHLDFNEKRRYLMTELSKFHIR